MEYEDLENGESGISDCSPEPSPEKVEPSPSKIRRVNKIIPLKNKLIVRLLNSDDESLLKFNVGLDDKSAFLLSTIYNYLNNESLKHLLDGKSQEILKKCFDAAQPGISIIRSLYWNQPPNAQFSYEEIELFLKNHEYNNNPEEVIDYLVEKELLIRISPDASNLKTNHVRSICKELDLTYKSTVHGLEEIKKLSQQKTIKAFLNPNADNVNKNERVENVILKRVGYCFKLPEPVMEALTKLYVLMYLGVNPLWISEGKLEQVIINDKTDRETYPINKNMKLDNATAVFKSSLEFTNYYNARLIYKDYLKQKSDEEKKKIVLHVYELYKGLSEEDRTCYSSYPVWLHEFTPEYIYLTILEKGVQILKILNNIDLALEILTVLITQSTFLQHNKAEWYADKAQIYKNNKNFNEAAKVFLEGLESNVPSDLKDTLRKRAKTLAHQQNTDIDEAIKTQLKTLTANIILESSFNNDHIEGKPQENTKKNKILFEVQRKNSVISLDSEDYCIWYYISEGVFTDGAHWEGRLVTTIFFLLFWDIIYTKPRGAEGIFLSYFQKYPLDIFTQSFYTNRKFLIDNRLKKIMNDTVENLINAMQQVLAERPLSEISEMYRALRWWQVRAVVRLLGARRVAALCARLATRGLHAWHGFPDLTLWNHHTGVVHFVEVKTDRDIPSMKQLQWMDYLRKNDMEVRFCYVGAETTRNKARAVSNA